MTQKREEILLGAGSRGQAAGEPLRLSWALHSQDSMLVTCHLSPETYSVLLPCHLSETGVTVAPEAEPDARPATDPEGDYRDDNDLVEIQGKMSEFLYRHAQSLPEQGEKKGWRRNSDGLHVGPGDRLDIDRRWAPRTHLELPVRITWRDVDGHRHETQGLTRDFSKTGIYFTAPLEVDAETAMQLMVNLPEEIAAETGLEALYLTESVRKEEGIKGLTRLEVGMAARFLTVPRAMLSPQTVAKLVPRAAATAAYSKWTKWK